MWLLYEDDIKQNSAKIDELKEDIHNMQIEISKIKDVLFNMIDNGYFGDDQAILRKKLEG